jgi:hypothetical protein
VLRRAPEAQGLASAIDRKVSFTIALPGAPRAAGSEGGTIWEGPPDREGASFHVQVSLDHTPSDIETALEHYGDRDVVNVIDTAAGYQVTRQTPSVVSVAETIAVPHTGWSLVCEAELKLERAGGKELVDPRGPIAWLTQVCDSVVVD